VIDAVAHQLAQEQGVAAGQLPQPVDAAAVHRAAQPGVEEGLDIGARELAHLKEDAQLVLPQRAERIRPRLVTPHAHHREGLTGGHELMHQRRRRVVEQLPVVDAQHEPAPGGALGERVTRTGQQLHALGRGWSVAGRSAANAPSGIDRAERDARTHSTAQPCARELSGLGRQPRLADPGRPGDHDATRGAPRQRFADQPKLSLAPGERPPHGQSLIDI